MLSTSDRALNISTISYLAMVHVAKQYLSVLAMSARSEFDYQFLVGSKNDYQLWKFQLYMYTSRVTGIPVLKVKNFPH